MKLMGRLLQGRNLSRREHNLLVRALALTRTLTLTLTLTPALTRCACSP